MKGLATAPFETALARGLIDAATPLDFDDPASLAVRTAQAEMIAAAYGVAVSPLRPAEARALEARLDQTAPEALPAALADLRAGFGDAAMAEVARRFETDRPHLAAALRLAEDRPEIAADIMEGGRRLKQALADGKADTLRPTAEQLQAASARVHGSETAAQTRTTEVEAATALYALRVADTTKPGFQPAVFDQAMRDVAPEGTLIDDFGALGVPVADATDAVSDLPAAATDQFDAVDIFGAPEPIRLANQLVGLDSNPVRTTATAPAVALQQAQRTPAVPNYANPTGNGVRRRDAVTTMVTPVLERLAVADDTPVSITLLSLDKMCILQSMGSSSGKYGRCMATHPTSPVS